MSTTCLAGSIYRSSTFVAILSASLIKAFAATLQLELETSFSIPATGEFEQLPIMGNNTSTVHGGALCVGSSNPVGASGELLAIQGIDYVGPLPPELQRSTVCGQSIDQVPRLTFCLVGRH